MKVTVLITAVGGGGFGKQVLKALRLSKTPYKIIGADITPFSYGLYEVDKGYLTPRSSEPAFIERLLEICKKEKVKVLIPGYDGDLKQISDNRDNFARIGTIALVNSKEIIDTCLDKWNTLNFLKKNGFYCLETQAIERLKDLDKITKFPVILKPRIGGGGSRHVYISRDKGELRFYASLLLKEKIEIIAQEYKGTSKAEYTVGVLALDTAEIVGSIALKREISTNLSTRLWLSDPKNKEPLVLSSAFSQGTIDDFLDIRIYLERVARAFKSTGPLNFQCRKTKKGIFIFEVNPRFSATVSIRAMLGFNEPDILIRYYLFGEKPKEIKYKKGLVLRGLAEKFVGFEEFERLSSKKDF